jgi:hypothetical protein
MDKQSRTAQFPAMMLRTVAKKMNTTQFPAMMLRTVVMNMNTTQFPAMMLRTVVMNLKLQKSHLIQQPLQLPGPGHLKGAAGDGRKRIEGFQGMIPPPVRKDGGEREHVAPPQESTRGRVDGVDETPPPMGPQAQAPQENTRGEIDRVDETPPQVVPLAQALHVERDVRGRRVQW